MVDFRRITLVEWFIIAALLSVMVALIEPDVGAFFDSNPDNTLPIARVFFEKQQPTTASRPVRIVVTQREVNANGETKVHCVLLNEGTTPVYYSGYLARKYHPRLPEGEIRPLVEKKIQQHLQGESTIRWRCGTGSTRLCLKPGHAGRFHVTQRGDEPVVRIGVYCHGEKPIADLEDGILWSETISAAGKPTGSN